MGCVETPYNIGKHEIDMLKHPTALKITKSTRWSVLKHSGIGYAHLQGEQKVISIYRVVILNASENVPESFTHSKHHFPCSIGSKVIANFSFQAATICGVMSWHVTRSDGRFPQLYIDAYCCWAVRCWRVVGAVELTRGCSLVIE